MIFAQGTSRLYQELSEFDLVKDPGEAKCIVLELPAAANILHNLPESIPVIVVLTGMINLEDWQAIQNYEMASFEELPDKASQYLTRDDLQLQIEFDNNPDDFFFACEQEQDTWLDSKDIQLKQQEINNCNPSQIPQKEIVEVEKELSNFPAEDGTINDERPENQSTSKRFDLFNRLPHNNRGYILTSFSAAGGVGKTFVSTNTAAYIAMQNISTVAVDLDLEYGDIDTATGLTNPENRNKVVDKKATVPRDGNWVTVVGWRKYARNLTENILKHNSGMFVIPSYPYAGNDIPSAEIEDLILTLAERFELVVIDLGVDAFSPHVSTALNLADMVFLIGGQDEKTIGKLTQFLNSNGKDNRDKMKLVINMLTPQGYFTPKEIAKKLNYTEYDEIPMDQQAVNAATKGRKLVVQLNGSTSSGNALKGIITKHLPFNTDYEITKPDRDKKANSLLKGVKSLFGRRK